MNVSVKELEVRQLSKCKINKNISRKSICNKRCLQNLGDGTVLSMFNDSDVSFLVLSGTEIGRWSTYPCDTDREIYSVSHSVRSWGREDLVYSSVSGSIITTICSSLDTGPGIPCS